MARLSKLQIFLHVEASEFARLPGRSYRCKTTAGQPRLLRPGRTCIVTFACTGYANRPNQAIDGTRTLTLLDSQPCRLLRSSRRYLCESFLGCFIPYPGGLTDCSYLFLGQAGLLYLLRFERVDDLGAYRIRRTPVFSSHSLAQSENRAQADRRKLADFAELIPMSFSRQPFAQYHVFNLLRSLFWRNDVHLLWLNGFQC
jgi:hypothetical protein